MSEDKHTKRAYVKRSTYQKVVEENKRLLRDIKILSGEPSAEKMLLTQKWRDKFAKDLELNLLLKAAAEQYIKDNPNDPAVQFVKGLDPDNDNK